jgi:adenosylcobinamide-GDP ribazoletransferase
MRWVKWRLMYSPVIHTCVHELRLFLIAMQFFTRIPIPAWVGFQPEWLQASVRYFAWIGVGLGALLGGLLYGLLMVFPATLAVVIVITIGIVLTGAFHEDGWADCCDAFGAVGQYAEGGDFSAQQQRLLAIMKDSRLGTYGVLGLGLLMTIKVLSLSAFAPVLLHDSKGGAAMMIAVMSGVHGTSRWAAVWIMYGLPYVQADALSKAKPIVQQVTKKQLVMNALPLIGISIAMLLGDLTLRLSILLMMVTLLSSVYFIVRYATYYLQRRLGGYTGDTLGAVQQVSETMLYVLLLVLMKING